MTHTYTIFLRIFLKKLIPCNGVTHVFANWRYNAFIYSPVYSALVLKANGVDVGAQQSMIDSAGSLVNNIPGGLSYYSRCWAIIGIITLNGDIAKAAVNIGISDPTPPAPTPSPSTPTATPAPTDPATSSPTDRPGDCKSWCAGNDASWETKCGWVNCSKCDKCNVISTSSPTAISSTRLPSSMPSSIPSVKPSSSGLPSTSSTPTVESDDFDGDYSELLKLLMALFPILQALIDLLNGLTSFTSFFGF